NLLASTAREELLATGARPRRVRLDGVEALTVSERRVARMAAHGRSNPEIAPALFVTRKTVEKQLARAYRTLDIRSPPALALPLRTRRAAQEPGRRVKPVRRRTKSSGKLPHANGEPGQDDEAVTNQSALSSVQVTGMALSGLKRNRFFVNALDGCDGWR